MERQVSVFNYRDPNSPVSILNRDGRLSNPPSELVEVLEQALVISKQTSGAFDVTVKPLLDQYEQAQPNLPDHSLIQQTLDLVGYSQLSVSPGEIVFSQPGMAVTLDGIAKGYIVDVGVAKLQSLGYWNVYVEAGGDLKATGTKPTQAPWKIGVQSPRDTNNILTKFNVSNQAVATSGDYMRYFSPDMSHHHIIDPRVGVSPTELASVTVLSQGARLSDAFATAIMVLGIDAGLAMVDNIPDMEALLVTKDNQLHQSAGFVAE